jgi:pyruvate,water dikinase
MIPNHSLIIPFDQCSKSIIAEVGGKNAALGELINHIKHPGFIAPEGFVISSEAFRLFLSRNDLDAFIRSELKQLNSYDYSALSETSTRIQKFVLKAHLPEELIESVSMSYAALCEGLGNMCSLAVRSSASAEDLPEASFAGIHESYLNIRSEEELLRAVLKCYASLYSPRAIKYREEMHFRHDKVMLSLGVQRMVRSDLACSGVSFSIDPDTGFRDAIVINATYGLGESIVQGAVVPDEFHVFKKKLNKTLQPISDSVSGQPYVRRA